jgi:hypothetical protein
LFHLLGTIHIPDIQSKVSVRRFPIQESSATLIFKVFLGMIIHTANESEDFKLHIYWLAMTGSFVQDNEIGVVLYARTRLWIIDMTYPVG